MESYQIKAQIKFLTTMSYMEISGGDILEIEVIILLPV